MRTCLLILIKTCAVLALAALCAFTPGCDPAGGSDIEPDAGELEADAAPPDPEHSLRACDSWDDCLGDPLPDGRRLDIGECCSAYAGVCVVGRMTGGCSHHPETCPYPGEPNRGVCMADTTVLPLPAEQCEPRQPADDWAPPSCTTDADCRIVEDGLVRFDGCCATEVGQCVKGSERDYYGYPAACAVRTDFAAPAALCEGV